MTSNCVLGICLSRYVHSRFIARRNVCKIALRQNKAYLQSITGVMYKQIHNISDMEFTINKVDIEFVIDPESVLWCDCLHSDLTVIQFSTTIYNFSHPPILDTFLLC